MSLCTATRLFVPESYTAEFLRVPVTQRSRRASASGTPAAPGTSRYVPEGFAGAGGGGAHPFREGPSPGPVAAASGGRAARARQDGAGDPGAPQ